MGGGGGPLLCGLWRLGTEEVLARDDEEGEGAEEGDGAVRHVGGLGEEARPAGVAFGFGGWRLVDSENERCVTCGVNEMK